MKRLLLFGGDGQVGWELRRTLAALGDVIVRGHDRLDLGDADALRTAVADAAPDIIVNAAAYTTVDQAETEADIAMRINATAPGIMAEEATKRDALLVHYSTDYVFDGSLDRPYREDDAAAPLNVYGRSKLAGEEAIRATDCRHLIFRTSWVYGQRGKNFLRTLQRLGREKEELSVVADQIGAPTWSRLVAEATALALRGDPPPGIYHLSCAGTASWHDFAAAILAAQGWRGRLLPIPACDYPLPARRPANSRLDNGKLARQLGLQLPDWRAALALCLGSGQ